MDFSKPVFSVGSISLMEGSLKFSLAITVSPPHPCALGRVVLYGMQITNGVKLKIKWKQQMLHRL